MTGFGFSALLWFVVVLAAIPAALWLLKRTPIGGAGAAQRGLRSVAVLPLSASQRLLTVEVGHGDERRWLVLGVTPTSITTLHTMAPQEDALPTLPALPPHRQQQPFSQLLARLRRGDDHARR